MSDFLFKIMTDNNSKVVIEILACLPRLIYSLKPVVNSNLAPIIEAISTSAGSTNVSIRELSTDLLD
jgi:hypothetical protein